MDVIAAARARAAELGDPQLAPPRPLEECDRRILESALAAPRTGWGILQKYSDLPSKGAALMYALSKSQACIDGNKRVALLLVDSFVRLNGCRLHVQPGELADMILEVADSDASTRDEVVRGLTSWLRTRLVKVEEGTP